MVANISSIKDLANISNIEFKTISICLDTVYDVDNVGIHHIFNEEREIVDCIRFYNQIWSIRQNLNLYLANIPNDSTSFNASWGDIYYPFSTSKKVRNRTYICDHVPFISKLKSALYEFSITFDNDTFIYEPNLNFIFSVPLEFGKDVNSPYTIFGDYFISFICFWHIYTSQAMLIAFNHTMFRNLKQKVNTFKYKLNLTMSLESKDQRNVIVQPFDMSQVAYLLTVNKMYQKFFVG